VSSHPPNRPPSAPKKPSPIVRKCLRY
jgi:hypothetical protein